MWSGDGIGSRIVIANLDASGDDMVDAAGWREITVMWWMAPLMIPKQLTHFGASMPLAGTVRHITVMAIQSALAHAMSRPHPRTQAA
jgi:hypothetical protein